MVSSETIMTSVSEWWSIKVFCYTRFFMLIVSDVSMMLSETFTCITSCLSYVLAVSVLFRFGASLALDYSTSKVRKVVFCFYRTH